VRTPGLLECLILAFVLAVLLMIRSWPGTPEVPPAGIEYRSNAPGSIGAAVHADLHGRAHLEQLTLETLVLYAYPSPILTGLRPLEATPYGRFLLNLPPTRSWTPSARDRKNQRTVTLEEVTTGAGEITLRLPGP